MRFWTISCCSACDQGNDASLSTLIGHSERAAHRQGGDGTVNQARARHGGLTVCATGLPRKYSTAATAAVVRRPCLLLRKSAQRCVTTRLKCTRWLHRRQNVPPHIPLFTSGTRPRYITAAGRALQSSASHSQSAYSRTHTAACSCKRSRLAPAKIDNSSDPRSRRPCRLPCR
jgi:hypothetical protein